MSRYAFALKPKWIFGHLLVIVLVIGFVSAGFWQIRRLGERQDFNAGVVANLHRPAVPVGELLPPGTGFDDVPDLLNRHVTATGRYLVDEELVINAQASGDGIPGVWIVTPLELADGRVLLVNRGWLPSRGPMTAPPTDAAPPTGEVTVTGLVSQTQTPNEGASAETSGVQQAFLRIDVDRIQEQFTADLVPAFLLRRAQTPEDAGAQVPQNLAPPELSDGPHLSYAIQWFAFTGVALVGYPTLLWIIGRDRREDDDTEPDSPATDDLPPGAFVDADGIIDMTGVDRPSAGAGAHGSGASGAGTPAERT